MPLSFIIGKMGGGKTLYAVKILLEELRLTERVICTNLPLKLEEIALYFESRFPNLRIDLDKRIRILSDSEAKEFWRFRGYNKDGYKIDLGAGDEAGNLDYEQVMTPEGVKGIMFMIDEAHDHFPSREWTKVSRVGMRYVSKSRHFGDDIVLITQHPGNVAKQLRDLAQDFTTLRNFKNERLAFFKLPFFFERKTYQELPGPNSMAFEHGAFRLDVSGVAKCYDTSAGVGKGIHSRADVGTKKRGLSIWFSIPIIVLLAVAVYKSPGWFSSVVMGAVMGGKTVKQPASQQAKTNAPAQQMTWADSLAQKFRPANQPEKTSSAEVIEEVYITGRTILKGPETEKWYLSDGRVVGYWEVACYQTGFLWLKDGQRFRWAPQSVNMRLGELSAKAAAQLAVEPSPSARVFNP